MRKIIGLLAILFSVQFASAQSWQVIEENEDTEIKYKWKKNKEGNLELRVRLKNLSKSDLNVDVEIAFYNNGILEQSSMINTCLKKGAFNNWFRNWHVIQDEDGGSLEEFEVKVSELNTEKVDECIETDADA
ncbi:MAG: hypothetical protein CMP59_10055 [Flavobacteriales bacterium]|nr:hypothetical protein [Flavobacteriales bacterium]